MKLLDLSNIERKFTIQYKRINFSGGERHIRILSDKKDIGNKVMIYSFMRSSDDIMELLLATDALKQMEIYDIEVFIPYIPYGRQDRVVTAGDPFSLKVFADLINAQNYTKVWTYDPHSLVSEFFIHNLHIIDNHDLLIEAYDKIYEIEEGKDGDTCLVCPDKGAIDRTEKINTALLTTRHYNTEFPEIIQCGKHRDLETGKLSNFTIKNNIFSFKGADMWVVDDICDGGGTFIGIAEELCKRNVGDLYLVVSHGIFSKGIKHLLKHYKYIFTTNSFFQNKNLEHLYENRLFVKKLFINEQIYNK